MAASFSDRAAIEGEDVDADLPFASRLGAVLGQRKIKLDDLMDGWDRNRDGVISKGEFRLHVRKLGFDKEAVGNIDGLFDSLDTDGTGQLTRHHIKLALRHLADEAEGTVRLRERRAARAERLRALATVYSHAAAEVAALERATSELDALRVGGGSIESRLGVLLCMRNTKVADIVRVWDANGDGLIDLQEFTIKLHELGLDDGPVGEHEQLFHQLDADSSGLLDLSEVQQALKRMQAAAAAHVAEEDAQEAVVGELHKAAKAALAQATSAKAAADAAAAISCEESQALRPDAAMPSSSQAGRTKGPLRPKTKLTAPAELHTAPIVV